MQAPNAAVMTRGFDCSYAQGVIDWQAVKKFNEEAPPEDRLVFVVTRATQGVSIVDNQFARNWQGIRDAGLLRGAYHFAVPGQTSSNPADDASRQAQAFVAAIRAAGGYDADLPCVLDLEQNPGKLAPNLLRDWAEVFCSVVDHLLGVSGPRLTMIYSGEYFLRSFMVPQSALGQRGLWLAWPSTAPVPDVPPWTHWTALQTSFNGHVPGVNGAIDTDLWAMTADEMAALYGAPVAPSGPKVMLWQHPVFEAVSQALAQQYGWTASNAMADVATASAVLCVGGAPDWIAAAKAACKGQWHAPLAGPTLWASLGMVAQAGSTGRF